MKRRTLTILATVMLALSLTRGALAQDCPPGDGPPPAPPRPGWGDGYPLGIGWGWTSKYYSVGRCPGFTQCRPWNPLFAVPVYSGIGQTGPRRMLLWPPTVGSPLYDNTPVLVPYPRNQRPCHGVICPY
jgi:hypothetical protein